MKKKLTKTEVDKLPLPSSGQTLVYDTDLIGFGIRLTPGCKTFFFQSRVHGKVRRVKLGRYGHLTADEARSLAKERLGEMAKGIDPNVQKARERAESITLSEVYEQFKQVRTLRPATLHVYDSDMRRCFADWSNKPITSISKEMVHARHRRIANMHGPRSNEGGAHAQANQAMRVLRAVLNFAASYYEDVDHKPVLGNNPVKSLSETKAWKKSVRRKTILKDEQLGDWYRAVMKLSNDTTRDYMLFCLFTGLRRSEAAKLKWTDIDTDRKTLTIRSENAKNAEEHTLPLSDYLQDILRRRRSVPRINNPFVFPGDGRDGHIVEPKSSVKQIHKTCGIKFMMHDLRRTFVTVAERLDISYMAVKRLVNHKVTNDVTAGYVADDIDRLREPMQRITNHLKECTERESSEQASEDDSQSVVG